jgi:uncharacterized protein (TIGR02246 family)
MADLMAEDVVFYVVGRAPIRGRNAFLELMRAGAGAVEIESTATMEEVTIVGDVAYCASHLRVSMTPAGDSRPGSGMRRAGYALSVLRRDGNGRWELVRDANMLAPEPTS